MPLAGGAEAVTLKDIEDPKVKELTVTGEALLM